MNDRLAFHEYADIFPMLPLEELDTLAADIAANGLLEPITIYEGKVLDGRNRYVACLNVAVDPRLTQYTGDDPLGFVVSKNLHRRHMNEAQRSVIAAKLANMPVGRNWANSANLQNNQTVTQAEAATMLNVSPRSVASVKAIERDAPDLLLAMESGELSVNAAMREVKERKREAQRESNRELVESTAPDVSVWTPKEAPHV